MNFKLFQTTKPLRCFVGLIFLGLVACERRDVASEPEFLLGIAGADISPGATRQGRLMGSNAVRPDLHWPAVEASDGSMGIPAVWRSDLDQAIGLGLTPAVILCYGHPQHGGFAYPVTEADQAAFVRYAEFSVRALPQVPIWEVWNEWNLGIGVPSEFGKGQPDDYVRLLAKTYPAIKAIHPDAIVLGGSMAGIGRTDDWTKSALAAGMLDHLDAVSYHPYCYWMDYEGPLPEIGVMGLTRELEDLLAAVPGGNEVPLYVSEIGWPTHDGGDGVTLEEQAKYLARAILLLRANPRVRGVWVYNQRDGDTSSNDREMHFGMIFSGGAPKPSYFAFADVARWLRRTTRVERMANDWDGDVETLRLTLRDGSVAWAIWCLRPSEQWNVVIRDQRRVRTVRVEPVGSGRAVGVPTQSVDDGSEVQVHFGDTPVIISGFTTDSRLELVDLDMMAPE